MQTDSRCSTGRIADKEISVSMIRLIATFMIIVCHMMQYEDFVLAWWLNVGVQIFLCMSGYLYGNREFSGSVVCFYKKQFAKILLDYYIVLIPIILLQFFFTKEDLSVSLIIKSLLTVGTLHGGGHLWYIPYILVCYLLTPFLAKYMRFILKKKNRIILLGGGILAPMFAVLLVTVGVIPYFNSAWLNCFLIGFFLGSCEYYEMREMKRRIVNVIYVAAFLMNGIQIYISYFSDYSFDGILGSLYSLFCNYAHVALGCVLFFGMKKLFSHMYANGYPSFVKKICGLSDSYSYDVYLVHQFFILGPFTLMDITESLLINVIVIIICVFVSAVIVCKIRSSVLSHFHFAK